MADQGPKGVGGDGRDPAVPDPHEVTQVLAAISRGDAAASEALLPIVYDELRRLAARRMAGERSEHTLQATALVHEAYLRLVDVEGAAPHWNHRGHFFAAAAEAMRRILVEQARSRDRLKRGGGTRVISLEHLDVSAPASQAGTEPDVLAVDEALEQLEQIDTRKHQVVMLRYFAGLTLEQTAEALDVSLATVKNDWRFARAWLIKALAPEEDGGSASS